MRKLYGWIFEAVGPKPLAQLAAAGAIGALIGVGAIERLPRAGGASPLGLVAGFAGLGLFAGTILVGFDRLNRDPPDGSPPQVPGLLTVALTALAVIGVLVAITFATMFLGSAIGAK